MAFHPKSQEGRLDPVVPLRHRDGEEGRSLGWPLAGVVVGLLFWLIALPLLGDPRISYRVTPVDGEGPPILIARSSFSLASGTDMSLLVQPRKPDTTPTTFAQAEAARPLLWAMATPGVAEGLGLEDSMVTIPTPAIADGPVGSSSGESAPPEPMFSHPERIPPGGQPVASLAQVMNPTEQPVQAELRPTVMVGDSRLCRALRMAAVSIESGAAPRLLMAGTISETMQEPPAPLIMEPGKRYDVAILVTLPSDLANEYQGVSCTVNFLMYFNEVV